MFFYFNSLNAHEGKINKKILINFISIYFLKYLYDELRLGKCFFPYN